MPRKKKSLSAAEAADVLDRIAERVARADTAGVDLQKDITLVEPALMDLKQLAGLRLLLRISQQHLLAGRPVEELRYDMLKRIARKLPPLDRVADAEALRALATQHDSRRWDEPSVDPIQPPIGGVCRFHVNSG